MGDRDEPGALEGVPGRRALDVRPMLAAGEEPLTTILAAAAGVSEGGSLEITAPFEPVPLYRVLAERGFGHRTEVRGPGEYVVTFTRVGITPVSTVAAVHANHPSAGPVLGRHGLDVCCGGELTLFEAAGAHGVDPWELLEELQAAALADLGGER